MSLAGALASNTNRTQASVVAGAIAAGLLVAGLSAQAAGWRQAALSLVGFGAGIALYHASFGFTSAWRRYLGERRSRGIRAQIIMIGATMLVSFPLLALGNFGGIAISGFVNPVGMALCVGAFIFGIGMQLGGGCGSGTLYTAGGGSTRMMVTLTAFIVGSLFATADPLSWSSWPAYQGGSLVEALGGTIALLVAGAILGSLYLLLNFLEQRKHGDVQPLVEATKSDALRGPWPLLAGALALALINIATFMLAGRPWGITTAFALWGAKLAALGGLDVAAWPYWQGDASLSSGLFMDVTSVMNFGLMLGALAAAGLAGKFAPQSRLPWRSLAAAVLGGLIMGVGARLATGCNIGALFSGAASGSLHAVVWLIFAVAGNWIGARFRPAFRLD